MTEAQNSRTETDAQPRDCVICTKVFTPSKRYRDRVTCCVKCQQVSVGKRKLFGHCFKCEKCGTWAESQHGKAKFCSRQCTWAFHTTRRNPDRRKDTRTERGPFTCQHCDKEYTTRRPRGEGEKYCSRECAYTGRAAKPKYSNIHIGQCTECGISFTARRARGQCGNDACRKAYNATVGKRNAASRHNADNAIHERNCVVCGVLYSRLYGSKSAICSDECSKESKRRHKCKQKRKIGGTTHRKRAKHYGVEYEPVNVFKVFERDQWRCQLCGISTPRELRGKHKPASPELDHIIPISKGGPHTYVNTQCLCRRCNGDKSATIPRAHKALYAA